MTNLRLFKKLLKEGKISVIRTSLVWNVRFVPYGKTSKVTVFIPKESITAPRMLIAEIPKILKLCEELGIQEVILNMEPAYAG